MTIFDDPSAIKGMVMGFALGALSFTAVTAWIVRGIQRTERELIQSSKDVGAGLVEAAKAVNVFLKEVKKMDDD